MTGRRAKVITRKDTGKPLSAEDIYTMVMMHIYQRIPIDRIARTYGIDTIEARVLIGRRSDGSCCG